MNPITIVDVNITGMCNYKCEYCFGEPNSSGHMNQATFQNTINFTKRIGATYLEMCGGEPLVHPLFENYVKLARRAGLTLILRTNGVYIHKHTELIADSFEWVGVSLDGTTEANDQARPARNGMSAEEKFGRPLEGIRLLKGTKPALRVLLATTATAQNYQSIPLLGRYVLDQELPIEKWKIYQFQPNWYRAIKNKTKFELSDDEFATIERDSVFEGLRSKGIQVLFRYNHDISGGCLLVNVDGTLHIDRMNHGNVNELTDISNIGDILTSDEITAVSNNKLQTFGDKE